MWCPDNRDIGNNNVVRTRNPIQTGILGTPSSNSTDSQDSSVTDPRVFRQGSSVCIFELFPEEYMNSVIVNLEVFARNCPVGSPASSSIIGLKYGALERGVLPTKKSAADKREAGGAGNRFQHQVQLRMRQEGAENISVKFFKTGRLQTAGCKTRAMSVAAVLDVAEAIAMMSNKDPPLLLVSNCERSVALELARLAPTSVRVVKECILGSFNSGFGGQFGSIIDMNSLFALLKTGMFSDIIERVKFNDEPGSHEAKFKQLGLYLKRACLRNADSDVFVNIFSSGKCTITAATTMELANEVMNKVSDILCNHYDKIVFRPKKEMDPLFARAKGNSKSSHEVHKVSLAEESLHTIGKSSHPFLSFAEHQDIRVQEPSSRISPHQVQQPLQSFLQQQTFSSSTDNLAIQLALRNVIQGRSLPMGVPSLSVQGDSWDSNFLPNLQQPYANMYGGLGLQYPQLSMDPNPGMQAMQSLLHPLPQRGTPVGNLMDAMRAANMPRMPFVPAMSSMGLNLITATSQAQTLGNQGWCMDDRFSAGYLGSMEEPLPVTGRRRLPDEDVTWNDVNSVQSKKPRIEEP